jgi:hypothetical protein
MTIPENVVAIHSMILDDQRISTTKTAETLVTSQERVCYIIHETDIRELSAKCIL